MKSDVIEKTDDDVLDYDIDFYRWLSDGDTISSITTKITERYPEVEIESELSAPPASPTNGVNYFVLPIATGLWAGREGYLATTADGGATWTFSTKKHLIVDRTSYTADAAKVWLSGGATGDSATLSVIAKTVGGRTKEQCFSVRIKEC